MQQRALDRVLAVTLDPRPGPACAPRRCSFCGKDQRAGAPCAGPRGVEIPRTSASPPVFAEEAGGGSRPRAPASPAGLGRPTCQSPSQPAPPVPAVGPRGGPRPPAPAPSAGAARPAPPAWARGRPGPALEAEDEAQDIGERGGVGPVRGPEPPLNRTTGVPRQVRRQLLVQQPGVQVATA